MSIDKISNDIKMLAQQIGKELDRVLKLLMDISSSEIAVFLKVGFDLEGMRIEDQFLRLDTQDLKEADILKDCLQVIKSYFIEDYSSILKKHRGKLSKTQYSHIYLPISYTSQTINVLFLARENLYENYFKDFLLDSSIQFLKNLVD